jgi:hypothetical protein
MSKFEVGQIWIDETGNQQRVVRVHEDHILTKFHLSRSSVEYPHDNDGNFFVFKDGQRAFAPGHKLVRQHSVVPCTSRLIGIAAFVVLFSSFLVGNANAADITLRDPQGRIVGTLKSSKPHQTLRDSRGRVVATITTSKSSVTVRDSRGRIASPKILTKGVKK